MRKQFTPSERVAIADSVKKALGNRQGQRTDTLVVHGPQVKGEKSREIAAKKAGFSSTTQFRNTKKVVEQGSPELVESLRFYTIENQGLLIPSWIVGNPLVRVES